MIYDKGACVRLLSVLFLAYAYICMSKNCFGSSMVFIVNEGLLTKLQTGTITAAFYLVYAVLQVVGGLLTDKWNPERFITVGLVGAGVSNLVIYFDQSYSVMLVSWVVNACLQFAVWPATFKIVSTMLRPEMQISSLFKVTFGNPVGVVLGYVLAAFVGSRWRLNFLVSALGLFLIAIIWEITCRSVKKHLTVTTLPAVEAKGERGGGNFLKTALRAGIILLLILSFTRTMFDLGMKAVAPTMINESYENISPVFATVLSIIILVSGAVGPFISRLIYPKFLRNESIIVSLFFLVALPLTALMLLIGRVDPIVIVILLALVVAAMSAASLFTTSYIAARFNAYGKGATVAGLLNCSASFGVVASNTLFTGLAEISWETTIIAWIVIMAVSLIISLINIPIWSRFLRKK